MKRLPSHQKIGKKYSKKNALVSDVLDSIMVSKPIEEDSSSLEDMLK
jgi:hypothetical protein